MKFVDVVAFVQNHFTDGLVLVIGSGLSAAEGLPGMPGLTRFLKADAHELEGKDAESWSEIAALLDESEGLESALHKRQPTESLESWIRTKTCELILPKEREIIQSVVRDGRNLRLTSLLLKVLKPAVGLPILTPNYDRLIEVACEMAGFHVDTTAIGDYAAAFDSSRSCMASCRGIVVRAKSTVLDHFPRAIVLKPHGSVDWYRRGHDALRCSMELDAERLIVTPGLNKYRAGYEFPFDLHRELANKHINRAARLLIVGYGFNDDHLQIHLEKRIQDGTPTLILTHTPSPKTQQLAKSAPNCLCLYKPKNSSGVAVLSKETDFDEPGCDLWDIAVLTKELLA